MVCVSASQTGLFLPGPDSPSWTQSSAVLCHRQSKLPSSSPPTPHYSAPVQIPSYRPLGTHLKHYLASSSWAGLLPEPPQCPPTHTHQGKAIPPVAQPPPISYPWQPDQPSLALQPFGERVVSTWSAHLRTAAASAGLSHHLWHRPSFPPPGPPPSPWAPSWLCLCAQHPAPRYQHRSFHLMLTAPPTSYKLCTGRFWHLPETEVSPVQ